MFLVALVLSAVAYKTGHGTIANAGHDPLVAVLGWLFMMQNLVAGLNVPLVAWTLSYEMVFYLLLAALFSWGVHRRSGWYAMAFAVGAVALGGVLPMSALGQWSDGPGQSGQLILNAVTDALLLAGLGLAVLSRSWPAKVGASLGAVVALVLVTVQPELPLPVVRLRDPRADVHRHHDLSSVGGRPQCFPRGDDQYCPRGDDPPAPPDHGGGFAPAVFPAGGRPPCTPRHGGASPPHIPPHGRTRKNRAPPALWLGLGPCGCCWQAVQRPDALAMWLGLRPFGCCWQAVQRPRCLGLWLGLGACGCGRLALRLVWWWFLSLSCLRSVGSGTARSSTRIITGRCSGRRRSCSLARRSGSAWPCGG